MFKQTGFRLLGLSLVLAGFSATAMGGGAFFDDFDQYADQTALEDSGWDPADSKVNGQIDTAQAFGRKSMRCEQTPSETRPRRTLGDSGSPDPGRLDLWFYDDGADVKAFNISVTDTGANTASVGLLDNQVASDTNYVCTFNAGSPVDTGIERSTGWHLVQFAVNSTTGTVVQIDKEDFTGNTLPALVGAGYMTVYTNLGNVSDANQVWIDTVNWHEGASEAVLPAEAVVGTIENFDTLSTTAWTPMTGTTEADLHHITDAGSDSAPLACIDVFDDGADRGFQGTLGGVVPINGKYRLSFDYENGGAYGGGIGPWENLTVTMNGTSSVNVGSAQVSSWLPAETTPAVDLTTAGNVNIQVTGDSTGSTGFCRLDTLSLILTEVTVPPASVSDWQLYGSDSEL